MRVSDFFEGTGKIEEGANDKNFRKLAKNVHQIIQQNLDKKIEPHDVHPDKQHPGLVEAWYLGSKLEHPAQYKPVFTDLVVCFTSFPGRAGEASLQKTVGYNILRVYVPGTKNMTPEEWKFTVWQEAAVWWKKREQDVFHELIHLFDFGRAGFDEAPPTQYNPLKVMDGDPKHVDAYVHDPWEWNAIIQDQFLNIEWYMENRKVRNWEQAKKVMGGGTPQEFFQLLWDGLDEPFREHFTEEDRRKFAKRAYQFWNDKKAQYQG